MSLSSEASKTFGTFSKLTVDVQNDAVYNFFNTVLYFCDNLALSFHSCGASADFLSHLHKFTFVFGNDVFRLFRVQVVGDVAHSETAFSVLFQRKFKKVDVIGFLAYKSVFRQQQFVFFQKSGVRKTPVGVSLFWKGTGKIENNFAYAVLRQKTK